VRRNAKRKNFPDFFNTKENKLGNGKVEIVIMSFAQRRLIEERQSMKETCSCQKNEQSRIFFCIYKMIKDELKNSA
jgi:hypothetical protein